MGSYRKGLLLSLGSIIQVQVDLQTVVPTQRSGLRILCPEHHQPLKQSYNCPEGHPVERWVKGKQTADGWQIPKEDEKPEFDADQAFDLVPVPADQLEAHTFAGKSIYYCQPTNTVSHEAWAVLRKILAKGKIALVTKGALRRGAKKLWRIDVFRDYLVLRDIEFPENIRAVPEQVDVKIPKATHDLVNQFIDNLMVSWDTLDTTDETRQQVEAWIAAGEAVAADTKSMAGLDDAVGAVISLQDALAKIKEGA